MRSVLVALVLIGSVVSAAAHPYHVAVGEARVNPETWRLEVMLQMWPEDLERALDESSPERFRLDDLPSLGAANWDNDQRARAATLAAYLGRRVTVRPDGARRGGRSGVDEDADPVDLVAIELGVRHVTVLFEVPLPAESGAIELAVTALVEVTDGQENTVELLIGDRSETVRSTERDPWTRVVLPDRAELKAATWLAEHGTRIPVDARRATRVAERLFPIDAAPVVAFKTSGVTPGASALVRGLVASSDQAFVYADETWRSALEIENGRGPTGARVVVRPRPDPLTLAGQLMAAASTPMARAVVVTNDDPPAGAACVRVLGWTSTALAGVGVAVPGRTLGESPVDVLDALGIETTAIDTAGWYLFGPRDHDEP